MTKAISIFSTEGKEILIEATEAGFTQWPRLQRFYRKQIGDTYCGIASLGIILECLIDAHVDNIDLSGK
ncbi:hypothetical protein HW132_36385 [Brasilonema sp. CT11]|nr:hypothetical protein [Brasilonema sp. CT11]